MLVKVTYRQLGQREPTAGISQTHDIGSGGLRFTADRLFLVGTVLEFGVHLPGDQAPFTVRGRVVWSRRTAAEADVVEYGVQFLNPSTETQRRLASAMPVQTASSLPVGGIERRQALRVELKLPIRYRPCDVLSQAWYAGLVYDLSLTGARLTGDRLLELNQTIELRVDTPARAAPYCLRGLVVSQREERPGAAWYEHGVQFQELSRTEQADLEGLVQFLESTASSFHDRRGRRRTQP